MRSAIFWRSQLKRGEDMPASSPRWTPSWARSIEETGDFIVNEKDKVVNLTEDGVKKVEEFFHIENLADPENLEIQHNIILALRATQPDVPRSGLCGEG